MPACSACASFWRCDKLSFNLDEDKPWKGVLGRSNLACVPPRLFLFVRFGLLSFWLGVLIWSKADWVPENRYGTWWIFVTNWSLLAEFLYLLSAVLSTMMAQCSSRPDGAQKNTPWFASVTWGLQEIVLVSSLAVFGLYWALVYEGGTPGAISVFTHGVNFAVMVLDFVLWHLPPYPVHMLLPVTFSFVYVMFTLIYYAADGRSPYDADDRFVYESLDWSTDPGSAAVLSILVVFVVAPAIHLVFYAFSLCLPAARTTAPLGDATGRQRSNEVAPTGMAPDVELMKP